MEDLEKMRNENTSPEDETFKVIPVNNINDIIKIAIIC
jgi:predicted ATP-dependent protease